MKLVNLAVGDCDELELLVTAIPRRRRVDVILRVDPATGGMLLKQFFDKEEFGEYYGRPKKAQGNHGSGCHMIC